MGVGLCAGYVGLVSYAFPGTWAGLGPVWSVAAMGWGATVGALSLVRLQPRQLRREVVEAQRAL